MHKWPSWELSFPTQRKFQIVQCSLYWKLVHKVFCPLRHIQRQKDSKKTQSRPKKQYKSEHTIWAHQGNRWASPSWKEHRIQFEYQKSPWGSSDTRHSVKNVFNGSRQDLAEQASTSYLQNLVDNSNSYACRNLYCFYHSKPRWHDTGKHDILSEWDKLPTTPYYA